MAEAMKYAMGVAHDALALQAAMQWSTSCSRHVLGLGSLRAATAILNDAMPWHIGTDTRCTSHIPDPCLH